MSYNIVETIFVWRYRLYQLYYSTFQILSVIYRVSRPKIAKFCSMYLLGDMAHPRLGGVAVVSAYIQGFGDPSAARLAASPFHSPVRFTRLMTPFGGSHMVESYVEKLENAVADNNRDAAVGIFLLLFQGIASDPQIQVSLLSEADDIFHDYIIEHFLSSKKDWRETMRNIVNRCENDQALKAFCRNGCRTVAKRLRYKSDPAEKKTRSLRDQVHKEAESRAKVFVVGAESCWPVGLCAWEGAAAGSLPEEWGKPVIPWEARSTRPSPLPRMSGEERRNDPYPPDLLAECMRWVLDVVKHQLRGSHLSRCVWEHCCTGDHVSVNSLNTPVRQDDSETTLDGVLEGVSSGDSRILFYDDFADEAFGKLDSREQEVFLRHTLAEHIGDPDGASATVENAAAAIGASHQTVYNINKRIQEKFGDYCSAVVFDGEEQYFVQALIRKVKIWRDKHASEQSR